MYRLNPVPQMVIILICLCGLTVLGGCDIDLSEQHQKDKAIVEKVNADFATRPAVFEGLVAEIKLDKSKKGIYKFKFENSDLDAQGIWDGTLKVLRVLERAEGVVATGRSSLTLHGSMGGELVVIGKLISGQTSSTIPYIIELQGSFANSEIVENWKRR